MITESLKRNYKRRDNKETFDNQSEGVIDRSYLSNGLRAEDPLPQRVFRAGYSG